MQLLAYTSGHRSELEAFVLAAWPVLGFAAIGAVVAVPLALRNRRRESAFAVGSALLGVAVGLLVVAWLL